MYARVPRIGIGSSWLACYEGAPRGAGSAKLSDTARFQKRLSAPSQYIADPRAGIWPRRRFIPVAMPGLRLENDGNRRQVTLSHSRIILSGSVIEARRRYCRPPRVAGREQPELEVSAK